MLREAYKETSYENEHFDENVFDDETTKEDEAEATLAFQEAAGQTKRKSGSVLLGLASYQCKDDWFASYVLRHVRPAPADRK